LLSPSISPTGHIHLSHVVDGDDGLPEARRARLRAELARGNGAFLVDLGACDVQTALPPALAFLRDLGKAFVARLAATPDLEKQRDKVVVPPPDLAAMLDAVPPMEGAEYVTAAQLATWWEEMLSSVRESLAGHEGTVAEWLQARSPSWHLVGRVTFHLAENRGDDEFPFAFLATYTTPGKRGSKPAHRPLGDAVRESAGDKARLLSLLVPVQRAAEKSPLVAELIDNGELYEAMAWTPAQARRFLADLPAFEEAGVIARVPDWWKAKRPPRPSVDVKIGEKPPSTLGGDSLVDFSISVSLEGDGTPLSRDEIAALLAQTEGLALVRGRWVELDRDRLAAVLDHWQTAEKAVAQQGLSFAEGMRLIAGAQAAMNEEAPADYTRVVAGRFLADTLSGLRGPDRLESADPGQLLHGKLRPYQQAGVSWLWFASQLRLGVCLADDMGLGKTIQVLSLFLLHQRQGVDRPHLLVVPASLLANWQAEAARFAPSLKFHVAHPSFSGEAPPAGTDVVLTTYGQLTRLDWLSTTEFHLAVLDEAQAIKNPAARQTRAAKAIRSQVRLAMTGTPVENRLGDLWSLFDFLAPGLLGSPKQFSALVRRLGDKEARECFAPLRRLVQPYILRRLKTDPHLLPDLPPKTEMQVYCGLSRLQATLYQRAVEDLKIELGAEAGMKRRGVILASLLRFKQICNHPSQWLGDGSWAEEASGKLQRLRELCEPIRDKQEKLLVFTQFRETTEPLRSFLTDVFGKPGLVLHGNTAVKERGELVKRFQEDDDVPFFVLSVKAGGTGLNLTAASHVVHFDRWWNPAVENQATDRAFRLGQKRHVLVHKFVCRGTVEEKIDALIESKKALAGRLIGGEAEINLTELGDDELLSLVALDLRAAQAEAA
jgi:non-specific serine/threonine protein kinase